MMTSASLGFGLRAVLAEAAAEHVQDFKIVEDAAGLVIAPDAPRTADEDSLNAVVDNFNRLGRALLSALPNNPESDREGPPAATRKRQLSEVEEVSPLTVRQEFKRFIADRPEWESPHQFLPPLEELQSRLDAITLDSSVFLFTGINTGFTSNLIVTTLKKRVLTTSPPVLSTARPATTTARPLQSAFTRPHPGNGRFTWPMDSRLVLAGSNSWYDSNLSNEMQETQYQPG
ncbi:hypothetical protein V8F20_003911 [Naviculisporaceae sp. PSN 640]